MARRRSAIAAVLDLASLLIALELASLLVYEEPLPWVARPGSWTMLGAIVGGGVIGLVISNRRIATAVPRPTYGRALTAVVAMLAITATVLVFTRAFWSRAYVLVTAAVWLGVGLAHRWVRRRRPWKESMAVVTNEKMLVEHLLDAPQVDLLSVLDPAGQAPDQPFPNGTTLVVDLKSVLSDDMARFVSSCSLAGLPVRSLVSVYEQHTGRLPIVHLVEGWEVTVPLSGHGRYVRLKRLIDTALVLAVSPLALLIGALVAAGIKIDSRGPVIYKQRRVGLEGKEFTLYKFRTMRWDPEDPVQFAAEDDERFTRFGRLLRRIRIDELPQLWNTLRGDLSLVGPRPEQGPFAASFAESIPFYNHRHLVRPGLTGWAQVNSGYADNESDTIDKLSYDLYYIKYVSPWFDLEVLGRSIWTVVSGQGAR